MTETAQEARSRATTLSDTGPAEIAVPSVLEAASRLSTNEQLTFADLPPRSHTNDPETSRAAERKNPGLRRTHMEAVLAAVRQHPGSTSSELSDWLYSHPTFSRDPHARLYQVRRRLSDLRIAGAVEIAGRRGDESIWRLREA